MLNINTKFSLKKSTLAAEYGESRKPKSNFPKKLVTYLCKKYQLEGKLVDIMPGRGEHALAFQELGLDIYLVDISTEAAEVIENRDERLSICDLNSEDLPYNDNSFDVVFCKSAIEHVYPDHFIPEMYRILKPGGKIIILTPDWYYCYRIHYQDHTHSYGCPWMKRSMQLILETHNFRNIHVENFYYLPFTWKYNWLKIFCMFIRFFPYPFLDNYSNPIWKLIRWSNEVQVLGYAVK